MKTTHSVDVSFGNLTLKLTCTLKQLTRVRQLTDKNLLIGENPLAGISDSNIAQILEALSAPSVPASVIADNMLDMDDILTGVEAISRVLAGTREAKAENPSRPE